MTRSKFSEKPVLGVIEALENGKTVAEVCRETGTSTATCFKWKTKFGGMETSDIRRMRALPQQVTHYMTSF